MKVKVVGMDPSLQNWGIVKAFLDIDTLEADITEMRLIETAPSKNKTDRVNSDDLRRATLLAEGMRWGASDVTVAFVETPVGSQSARAMASYGICIGLLSSLPCSLIQVTPYEVKIAGTNYKLADKQEMIDAALAKHPNAPWLRTGKRVIAKNEHLADATFAIHAGVKTAAFRTVLAMLRAANQVPA